jgi:hypothetical protein
MVRAHPQRSAELDEVREAIGLRPARPAAQLPTSGQSMPWLSIPNSDLGRREAYPTGSLSGRIRRLAGLVTAVAAGVALTHQLLAGALASAHGAGPWGAAAALLAWPVPLAQPTLAGAGALILLVVGMITGGWRRIEPRQGWLLAGGAIAAVLGAGPMVLICLLTAAVCVLAIMILFVIIFYILPRLLQ